MTANASSECFISIEAKQIAIYIRPEDRTLDRQEEVYRWLKSRGGRLVSGTTLFFRDLAPSFDAFKEKFGALGAGEGYAIFGDDEDGKLLKVLAGDTPVMDKKIRVKPDVG